MDKDAKDTLFFLLSLFGNVLTNRASILMYHSVGDNNAFFTVHPKDFEQQLQYLTKNNFILLSLSDLITKMNRKSDISNSVSLTFDDGYQDNYECVFPLLKKYNVPATFFLTTGSVGKTVTTSEGVQLPLLNHSEIQEMKKNNLIEFMPHTHEHIPLTELSIESAIHQIEISRKSIEEFTAKPARILSYPKGRYAGYLVDYLKDSDWLGAVTVEEGLVAPKSDPFILPRNSIDSSTTFVQFKGKVSSVIKRYVRLKSWLP